MHPFISISLLVFHLYIKAQQLELKEVTFMMLRYESLLFLFSLVRRSPLSVSGRSRINKATIDDRRVERSERVTEAPKDEELFPFPFSL